MKKFLIVAAILVLAACAPRYPLNTNLNLQIMPAGQEVYRGASASVRGVDHRENPEVVRYLLPEGVTEITNLSPPHLLVAERLAVGLRQQGLLIESSAPASMVVELQELVAEVTKPKMLYETRITSKIQVSLANRGTTLSKNYNLESTRESLTKPKVEELEEMLNKQLTDIANQIMEDRKVQEFLQE